MEIIRVVPSRPDSYERLCHDAAVPNFLLDFGAGRNEAIRYRLLQPRLERFIGVIYRPETELRSHYVEASLPRQFDAYVWLDQTTAEERARFAVYFQDLRQRRQQLGLPPMGGRGR